MVEPPFSFLKARVDVRWYLFDGPRKINEKYSKAIMAVISHYNWSGQLTQKPQSNGEPFQIDAPDRNIIFVSSPQRSKKLDTAGPDRLSLFVANKQV